MKIDDMFPRKYASGEDLGGKAVRLSIQRVDKEEVYNHGEKDHRFVIYFDGAQRGVLLSRTLAQQIAEAVGQQDTNHWVGQVVELYPVPMTVGGVPRVAIRARRAGEKPKAGTGRTPADPLDQGEDLLDE
jgi:hypothetical protein